jgi:hypothetical protein
VLQYSLQLMRRREEKRREIEESLVEMKKNVTLEK